MMTAGSEEDSRRGAEAAEDLVHAETRRRGEKEGRRSRQSPGNGCRWTNRMAGHLPTRQLRVSASPRESILPSLRSLRLCANLLLCSS